MGGDSPSYYTCGYVPPQRVWFLRCFDLKTSVDFAHFGLNRVWFSKKLPECMKSTYLSFQYRMNMKERVIFELERSSSLFRRGSENWFVSGLSLKTGVLKTGHYYSRTQHVDLSRTEQKLKPI